MAAPRRFDWRAFLLGMLALLLLAILAGALISFGGLFPVAASNRDSAPVRWLLEESREHAVDRSAAGLKAPQFSAADILEGGSHFKGMCQECHGAPGADREEFAGAMDPRPPDLARAAGDLSVEQVFWIAKNGIKMTGMPAFGKTDPDEDLWKVAAFVKQLRNVTPARYAALPNAHEHESGHEHHH